MAKNKSENLLITFLASVCITMVVLKLVPTLAGK